MKRLEKRDHSFLEFVIEMERTWQNPDLRTAIFKVFRKRTPWIKNLHKMILQEGGKISTMK